MGQINSLLSSDPVYGDLLLEFTRRNGFQHRCSLSSSVTMTMEVVQSSCEDGPIGIWSESTLSHFEHPDNVVLVNSNSCKF